MSSNTGKRTRRGFGKPLLTCADGVKLFIKEMVACAFISLFQSHPLIPFIRLSLCPTGFHVEKKLHTKTHKDIYHTPRPWFPQLIPGLLSIVSMHIHTHIHKYSPHPHTPVKQPCPEPQSKRWCNTKPLLPCPNSPHSRSTMTHLGCRRYRGRSRKTGFKKIWRKWHKRAVRIQG